VDEPRITALMPLRAYHPRFLEESIDSLRGQTSPRWRLLIVDDGAKPTPIVRDALADPRVALVRNDGKRLAAALNTGMRHARTDFVASLFADDMWAPEAVHILTEHIEADPSVDFLHTGRVFIDEDGRRISVAYRNRDVTGPADFATGSPTKHLLCWRRERGLSIGGIDESLNSVGPDDWDFPWRMAEDGAVFRTVVEPLYMFRDHRECERLTTHLPRSVHKREMRRIMRKHGVPRPQIEHKIAVAEGDFLRQCIYRSRFDRWIKTLWGYDPRHGWRKQYRQQE
jgi:glycosyltransferase involved in cell wall biosynthesis